MKKRLRVALRLPESILLGERSPFRWPAPLFPFQTEGVSALTSSSALLLADEMGLGKTIQAIAALRILVLRGEVHSALIVVPASLVSQWRRELRLWAPELRMSTVRGVVEDRAWQWDTPAHVYLTSYETLRSDFTDNPLSPPRKRKWDVVILDEAQKIKNRDVEVSRKCKELPRVRAWALTGTPLENSVDDLLSVLEFVAPHDSGSRPVKLSWDRNTAALHEHVQLRRKKRDVLTQLPPKITSKILLPLHGAQKDSYDAAERSGVRELREQGESVTVQNALALITKLKQICNFCPRTGESVKLSDIAERLPTLIAAGERALIFSQFVDEKFGVRAVASRLEFARPLLFTGDLGPAKDQVIRRFEERPEYKVLVISLRAGGQGLNLQDASYVFHFDRWWNPAIEAQADGRSHRYGQTRSVHVYKYVCEGTIEERIDQILEGKQALFDEYVDDISLDLNRRLSSAEIFGLLGLKAPKR